MTATSASDRYEAARKALEGHAVATATYFNLPESEQEGKNYEDYEDAMLQSATDLADALHALIEPPATEETPEEIAGRIIESRHLSDSREEWETAELHEHLVFAVHAGIQAAWESWEPENSPGYEPEQTAPAFKPEGEPDEYRDIWYKMLNRDFDWFHFEVQAHTYSGQKPLGGIPTIRVKRQQARRILEMLSSEASA